MPFPALIGNSRAGLGDINTLLGGDFFNSAAVRYCGGFKQCLAGNRRRLISLILGTLFCLSAPSVSYAQSFEQAVVAVRSGRLSIADLQSLASLGRSGDARSAQLLAWLLATGREVPVNLRLALVWYLQSYVDGMPKSLDDARLVLSHMHRADIAALNPAIITLAQTGSLRAPRFAPETTNSVEVRAVLRDEAAKVHLVPALAEAVGYVESRFHSNAVSSKGARGVMQIMPATGAALQTDPNDLFDARTNIRTGVKYLTMLLQQYGRIDKALAHYVGGTAAAAAYPAASSDVQKYVADVLAAAPQFAALDGGPLPKGGLTTAPAQQIAAIQSSSNPRRAVQKSVVRQGPVLIIRGGPDD